jgi:hypothetical protein
MKKIIALFTFIIGFTSFNSASAQSQAVSKSEFKFETESHDFGKIKQNNPVTHIFNFTNVGAEPIIIYEVRPSCGCSVAEFTKTPIAPNQTGTVSVKFDAAAKGPFTKHLTVRSNTKTPIKTLVIKGEVID